MSPPGRASWSTRWKVRRAVLAQDVLHPLGIVDARQLHDDPVVALALNGRFAHAGFVDPAADDLDRLRDRVGELAPRLIAQLTGPPVVGDLAP